MVRLFDDTLFFRVPCADAIVDTRFNQRIEPFDPFRIPADTPVPVSLDDASELAVACRMESVFDGTDRKIRPECLMSPAVLVDHEFRFAQGALHVGKQVRQGLGVVPDMRTCAVAASARIVVAFPAP